MQENICIELTNQEIQQLKDVQIELLDELKAFCENNDIRFYLFAGTLLGAIRHKGFIPWDDDIDVCMPRKDYEKFLSLYKENDKYFLQTANTDKYYYYNFAKLMKKGTIYSEYVSCRTKCQKGIFIDIFPVSGIPDKNKKIKFANYYFWLFVLNKRAFPKKFNMIIKNKHGFVYKLLTVISWILLWWCPCNHAARMRNNFMRRHSKKPTKECICGVELMRPYPFEAFSGEKDVEFEGRMMPAMADPTIYLKIAYGDFMSLPPEKDRVPHHFLTEFKG